MSYCNKLTDNLKEIAMAKKCGPTHEIPGVPFNDGAKLSRMATAAFYMRAVRSASDAMKNGNHLTTDEVPAGAIDWLNENFARNGVKLSLVKQYASCKIDVIPV